MESPREETLRGESGSKSTPFRFRHLPMSLTGREQGQRTRWLLLGSRRPLQQSWRQLICWHLEEGRVASEQLKHALVYADVHSHTVSVSILTSLPGLSQHPPRALYLVAYSQAEQ